MKLQLNGGGGACFPLHFDTDADLDGRRVTALVYLNPEWAAGDGGELMLYPFPHAPVKVQPAGHCPPRHSTHWFEPYFLVCDGIL